MSCRGQDITFEVTFSSVSTSVWWVLFATASAVWLFHRHNQSKSKRLYNFLYTVIALNAISEALYLVWIVQVSKGNAAQAVYYLFIFMDKLALSSFVALMLVCAAGFCITRDDLGPHGFRVLSTPIIWLITGWITGFVWYATQDSPDDWCTTSLKQMTQWQATVWFVCSIINLATYLMAWIYIFAIMGEEMEALEAAEKLLSQKSPADGQSMRVEAEASERIVRTLLGPQGNSSHIEERPTTEVDVEAARELETFAGRVDFMLKKKLLYRFALGCGAYLFALICVLLIPVFDVEVLETTLYWLEATVKWCFMGSLIHILRPTVTNPYLSLDLSNGADVSTALAFFDDEDDSESGLPARANHPPPPYRSPPPKQAAIPLADKDVGRRTDQVMSPPHVMSPAGAPAGAPAPTGDALEEHKKKFSLDEEEEEMQEIGLRRPHNA